MAATALTNTCLRPDLCVLGCKHPPQPSARPTLAFKTIPQGAASSVWAATAPELAQIGGVYIQDCQVAEVDAPSKLGVKAYAVDPDAAERLWAISEKMVGETFAFA